MSKPKVHIISGWSAPGGSTVHHVNLTNLLNKNGYDCKFYGPHPWPKDMCNFGHIGSALVGKNDFLISHFMGYPHKISCRKHILSCHERFGMFPISTMREYDHWEVVQFVSEHQRKEHALTRPTVVIPPQVKKVNWTNPKNDAAGVIGSIDHHKQTHVAIQEALDAGFSEVLVFGEITDLEYFEEHMEDLVRDNRIRMMKHEDDMEAMYAQVEAVYHASLSETFGMVEAECKLAGIPFHGPSSNPIVMSEEEILQEWKKLLQ